MRAVRHNDNTGRFSRTLKSKPKIIGLSLATLLLAFGAVTFYSYRRLLVFERLFMPSLPSLPAHYERSVSFMIYEHPSATWLPHWTVTYQKQPMVDTDPINPFLTVDLCGRIASAGPKEVSKSVETYQQQHQ